METTTKNCKTEKVKSENGYARSNSKSLGNHVVSPEEEKERLRWKGRAGSETCDDGVSVVVESAAEDLVGVTLKHLLTLPGLRVPQPRRVVNARRQHLRALRVETYLQTKPPSRSA